MTNPPLQFWHLGVGALSMLVIGVCFWVTRLGLVRSMAVSAIRMCAQLLLLGLILELLFEGRVWWWTVLFLLVMIIVATRESTQRLRRRLQGIANLVVPFVSLLAAALPYTALLVLVVFRPQPWHEPSILLPVFGMILGNVMNTVSLALNQFFQNLQSGRHIIEQRLALGHEIAEITRGLRVDAARTAMLPILNAMAVTGIVSLPGMMTGQILAGESPEQAVRYQILIWFGIASGAGAACLIALHMSLRAVTDSRGRPARIVDRPR